MGWLAEIGQWAWSIVWCLVLLTAALLVAVDPILLRDAAFPMTETLATCLVTGLLLSMTGPLKIGQGALTGLLFGLTALTRPTVWAFAILRPLTCGPTCGK